MFVDLEADDDEEGSSEDSAWSDAGTTPVDSHCKVLTKKQTTSW